jgi:hypothetical protein
VGFPLSSDLTHLETNSLRRSILARSHLPSLAHDLHMLRLPDSAWETAFADTQGCILHNCWEIAMPQVTMDRSETSPSGARFTWRITPGPESPRP